MRRRTFIASVVAGTVGLAGCSSSENSGPATDGTDRTTSTPTDDSTRTETPTDRTTSTPTDRGRGEPKQPESPASVVELETIPRTYAFAPTTMPTDDRAEVALWFDRTATTDHPARLTGWLRNANDFENTFRLEWIPAVGRTFSRQPSGYDHEARLFLVPTEGNDLTERSPPLGRTDEGHWYVDGDGPSVPKTYRMAPQERIDLEYVVVGTRETPGRPTGTYEFRGDDETARITVWNTDSPGPEGESRFADRSVPALDGDRSVQWYHEADATTAAFVRPSAERLELDGSIEFEAVNNSHESLRCGHWNLHKLVDGRWFHVAPVVHTSDCRSLVPGERKRWTLRAFNGESVPCGGRGCGCDGLTRGYLGGGEYAVVAGYGLGDASTALVELVGDPVTLTTTEGATVERNDGTVVVTTGLYGDEERPPDATFTVRRVDSAEQRVIAEQIMTPDTSFGTGGPGLRNALAVMADDVDEVVVRTDKHDVDSAVGHDASTRRIRFRWQAYVISRGQTEG